VSGAAESDLDRLARLARDGSRLALERLVESVRDDVYRLSMRMLWHPADAEDATQEILIKLVTGLASFRGEASFRTWALAVSANHLRTTRRRRAEAAAISFEAFGEDLATGLDAPYDDGGVDERLLEEEVKVGCTQAMLLCLDREHRLAYILGEVFELPGSQAAHVLGVSPAAYRKRLSRGRARIRAFMRGHCGLADPSNPCRCRRRIGRAIEVGRLDPTDLRFAAHPRRHDLERPLSEMEGLNDAAAIMRSGPAYLGSEASLRWIGDLLRSGRLSIVGVGGDEQRPGAGPGTARRHGTRKGPSRR
jgi:RNA polymerase sigma factor (sigma-70 family)